MTDQIEAARARTPEPDLAAALAAGETWTVG
jgi:hypothetical protein